MDEKKPSAKSQQDDDMAMLQMIMQQAGESGGKYQCGLEAEDLLPRAAGDVTFTAQQTCLFYLQGNNAYIKEILDTAHAFKTKGKSLLEDNEEFFDALQEIEEKIFYPVAACNLKLKAQSDLEVEADQAIWYYEKTSEPTFIKLHTVVNLRNHRIMGLLTTQELESAQILEIQREVLLVPNAEGEVPASLNKHLKWLSNLEQDAQETGDPAEVEEDLEPILPIEGVSTPVSDLVQIYARSAEEYYSRVLDLAEKYLQKGLVPSFNTEGFSQEYEAIKPNRQKVIQDLKLQLSDDEYEMAIMFYTQSRNKEFKEKITTVSESTQQILSKLQGEGLNASDIQSFRKLLANQSN